jgi:PKD repeat protein
VVVAFTATATPPPPSAIVSTYQWDFGDGQTTQTPGNQVTHTYNAASPSGGFIVKVTITTTRGGTAFTTVPVVIP